MPARLALIRKKNNGMVKRTTTIKFSRKSFVGENSTLKGKSFKDLYEVDYKNDKIEENERSAIYVCRHKESGEERAVKVCEKSKRNEDENARIDEEFALLKTMDHPNIIQIFEIFEDENHKYVVMDYCRGGELHAQMFRGTGFSQYYSAVLIKTLLGAVNYMYSKHDVVHLGLNPTNILLEGTRQTEQLKLIDFGSSIISKRAKKLDRLIGEPRFLAPETLQFNMYSHKTDMWAIGVIAYACLAGRMPFDGKNDRETLELIMDSKEQVKSNELFSDEAWEEISDDAIDFISKLLSHEQFKRPSAKEALKHPWIQRITEAQAEVAQKHDNALARQAMDNLFRFNAPSKLQQAALTYIASQLLSKHDSEEFDHIYQAIDFSATGKISKDDLKKACSIFLGVDLQSSEVAEVFQKLDMSSSDYIEYSEWLLAALPEEKLLTEENLHKTFEAFDKDGDGNITAGDLKQVLGFFLDVDDDSMDLYIQDKILKQVDSNTSGSISFEIFESMLRKTKNGPGRDFSASPVESSTESPSRASETAISIATFEQCKLAFERNCRK